MFIKNNTAANSTGGGSHASRLFSVGFAAFMMVLMLSATSAMAAAPAAGSQIKNTASATYSDNGVSQEVFSNEVTTTVSAVGSFDLKSDTTKVAKKGDTFEILHTLTNNGNDTDTFKLTLPDFTPDQLATFTSFKIFQTDAAGVHIGGELCTVTSVSNTCTGSLVTTPVVAAGGGKYYFVIETVVKSTAANIDNVLDVVTATPSKVGGTGAITYPVGGSSPPATGGDAYGTFSEKINTDTVSIHSAAITVLKTVVGTASGPRGTIVTYHLSYTNASTDTAGSLYISDAVGLGSVSMGGVNYVPGSGKWAIGAGAAQTMTDSALDSEQGDTAQYSAAALPVDLTAAANPATATTVTAAIYSVPANGTGYIEFQVIVLNTATTGTGSTTNKASYGEPDGACNATTIPCLPPTSPTPTPEPPFTVTSGTLDVVKTQATSTGACPADASGLTFGTGTLNAKPGDCIWYRIEATNSGTAAAQNAVLHDTIPTYTTYAKGLACGNTALVVGTPTITGQPAPGAVPPSPFSCGGWTSIPVGEKVTMEFAVQVDQ